MARGGGDARMFRFSLTASKASGNLPEGVGPAQMAIEPSQKLAPAGEYSARTRLLSFWRLGKTWLLQKSGRVEYKKKGDRLSRKINPQYSRSALLTIRASARRQVREEVS